MAMYRIFASADGESHIEDLNLEDRPELGALTNLSEARVQEFDGSRNMDFHPLPERRLIVHLSGEVEIGDHRRPKAAVPCRRRAAHGRRERPRTQPRRPFPIGRRLHTAY